MRKSPAWTIYNACESDKEKVALITGASSPIGKAAARQLALKGYQVVLAASHRDKLERIVDQIQIDGGRAQFLTVNLENEEESTRLHMEITSKIGPIDILVNSGEAGWYGFSDNIAWQETKKIIDLNVRALTSLTLLFLADMRQRGQGLIINVSPAAGGLSSQGMAQYSATKSYGYAFTTALHHELRGSGIHLSSVRSGVVRTPFLEPIMTNLKSLGLPVRLAAERPERVAAAIVNLVQKPRRVVYVPRILRIIPWIEVCLSWVMDFLDPLVLGKKEDVTLLS